jgi:hypothetical protein
VPTSGSQATLKLLVTAAPAALDETEALRVGNDPLTERPTPPQAAVEMFAWAVGGDE